MAVEATRIKERLKELFPKANLSTKRLDAIAERLKNKPDDNATDEQVDEIIKTANDFHSFEEIARDDDKMRTLEAKSKGETKPTPDPIPEPRKEESSNKPEWLDEILESNRKLAEKIEVLEKGKATEDKKVLAKKAFDDSEVFKPLAPGLKERYLNRFNLDSDISFEDQVKDFEQEYTDLVQGYADSRDISGAPPVGSSNQEATDAEVNDIVG